MKTPPQALTYTEYRVYFESGVYMHIVAGLLIVMASGLLVVSSSLAQNSSGGAARSGGIYSDSGGRFGQQSVMGNRNQQGTVDSSGDIDLGAGVNIDASTIQQLEADLARVDQEIANLESLIGGFQTVVQDEYLVVTAQEMLGYGRTGCFVAGTPVLKADGTSAPIETINPGDMVMSFDPQGNLAPGEVLRRVVTPNKEIVNMDGVQVTLEHLFVTKGGKMVPVQSLLVGDTITKADGSLHTIATLMPEPQTHEVHNLIVKDHNTFIAAGFRVGGYDATGIVNLTAEKGAK
jgi:hypothetical protein